VQTLERPAAVGGRVKAAASRWRQRDRRRRRPREGGWPRPMEREAASAVGGARRSGGARPRLARGRSGGVIGRGTLGMGMRLPGQC
jgi:hypothetical protein